MFRSNLKLTVKVSYIPLTSGSRIVLLLLKLRLFDVSINSFFAFRYTMKKKYLYIIVLLIIGIANSEACTECSAKAKNGNIWHGGNEDKPFSLGTRVNIVAPAENCYGYFYTTNSKNPNEFPQGGMNEAGLSFGGTSVPSTTYKDFYKKKDFPGGSSELMFFIFRKCKTVKEVFALFKIYRVSGLEVSQFHFADKYGNFGIIVADSMWLTHGEYQISTNYNLCHPDKDSVQCWRYPMAERILTTKEIGLETLRELFDSTSQRKWTNHTEIKNLTTGDIWFYYAQNFSRSFKTNIKEFVKSGNRTFYLYELFKEDLLLKHIMKSKETEDHMAISIMISFPIILFLIIYSWVLRRRLRKLRDSKSTQ